MSKTEIKFSFKDLLKRGMVTSFIIGIFTAIIQDEVVSKYFLQMGTIVHILLFTIVGGLLYSWGTSKLIKIINRKKDENSA